MRFHLPHKRSILSPLIDLPGYQPRMAGFYATPPGKRNDDFEALHHCSLAEVSAFAGRIASYRQRARERAPWNRYHWGRWKLGAPADQQKTPRVPHLFSKWPEAEGSSRMVTVQHVSFSPRIRYVHRLLSPGDEEAGRRVW